MEEDGCAVFVRTMGKNAKMYDAVFALEQLLHACTSNVAVRKLLSTFRGCYAHKTKMGKRLLDTAKQQVTKETRRE